MCRVMPEVNRLEVFQRPRSHWSCKYENYVIVKSHSLAAAAIQLCCTVKRSLNAADMF